MENIRDPAVSGSFYPSNPDVLGDDVRGYLRKAEKEVIEGEIIALISPHAGYAYSGQVAAYAYKLVEGMDFDDVVVIAPSHQWPFEGASIYRRGGFRTPLGVVPIDGDMCDEIMALDGRFQFIPEAHLGEHSLEVQLPFLQVSLKGYKLVPIVLMGGANYKICQSLGKAISESMRDRNCLIVASSDLTHSYNYQQVVAQDEILARHIDDFDIEGLAEDLRQERCQACGEGPILSAMVAAKTLGGDKGKVLKLTNSGDVTGDKRSGSYTVGYLAGAFYRAGIRKETH
ncbi:MAG: AmmeMemoRadiSam system protein B [Syntrophobacterales bacterium]|nr:MAG: AmmeMemoRadiSam system protein B [Syntrophobacterales bacterium]